MRMLKGVAHGCQPFVQLSLVLDAFVGPVGRLTVLRLVIHPLCPDLNLKIGSAFVLDGDVQGLVAVRLRIGHPVPQTLRVGFIFLGHVGVHFPAEVLFRLGVRLAVDDEADGEDIIDSLERNLLLLHLSPDGICRLGPYLQLVMDAVVGKGLLERFDELLGQPLAVPFRGLELIGEGPVLLRLGETEVDVLHLALDVVESELVGQRDVKHQGLKDFPFPGRFREHLQMAHDLQPVGDLEDCHPRVGRVLDDQLLVALGFKTCVLGLDRGDLVQPLDHRVHILRKPASRFRSMSP